MKLSPAARKVALTTHVVLSVGWVGAVAAFLALAIAGLASSDLETVRAAYVAMNVIGWTVIVPLSLASLPSGLVISLGTEWGIIRHYWVLAKLVISVLATALLLLHMQPVGQLARAASEITLNSGELAGLRVQLIADAVAALVVLIVATALSVYKPRGLTKFGVSAGGGERVLDSAPVSRSFKIGAVIAALLVTAFLLFHLLGGSVHGH